MRRSEKSSDGSMLRASTRSIISATEGIPAKVFFANSTSFSIAPSTSTGVLRGQAAKTRSASICLSMPGSKPDMDKQIEADRVLAACPRNTPVEVLGAIEKLVEFAKNTFAGIPSVAEMMDLVDARNIEPSEDFSERRIAECGIQAMRNAMVRDSFKRISFNDMVWLPVAMGWVRPCYDLV